MCFPIVHNSNNQFLFLTSYFKNHLVKNKIKKTNLLLESKSITIQEGYDVIVNIRKVSLVCQSCQHLPSNFMKSFPSQILTCSKNSLHIFKFLGKSLSGPVLCKVLKNLLDKSKHLGRMITGNTMKLHLRCSL